MTENDEIVDVIDWLDRNPDKVGRDFWNGTGEWEFFVDKSEIPQNVIDFVEGMNRDNAAFEAELEEARAKAEKMCRENEPNTGDEEN